MAKEPSTQDSRPSPSKERASKASSKSAGSKSAGSNGTASSGKVGLESPRFNSLDEPGGIAVAIRGFFRSSPSWLTSMVVHVTVLLILGLCVLPEAKEDIRELLTSQSFGDQEGETEIEELGGDSLEKVQELNLDVKQTTNAVGAMETSIESVIQGGGADLEGTGTGAPAPGLELGGVPEFGTIKSNIFDRVGGGGGTGGGGNGLKGRSDGAARAAAVRGAGGTPGSEKAVAMALKWIAEHQLADGGWSFDHRPGKCGGRCKNQGTLRDGRFAATGLALMAFLGAGQTHKQGEYKQNVYRGLQFLTMNQNKQTGQMYRPGEQMYAHGIATIALCEATGMTDDRQLLPFAKKGIAFILLAQDRVGGGWRYSPGEKGDTSVVGWQLMALKSAKWAYIKIPPANIAGVNAFLNSVQIESGAKYGYAEPGAGPATSAIGLLCRMHLGWKKDNPALERGVKFLGAMGPSPNNMYYNYYATQVMRHFQGEDWTKWNNVMREQLIKTQSAQGHEAGSWFAPGGDHGAEVGGRHYCTCMNAMTLEVYYRHFPLYQTKSTEDDFAD